MVKSRRTRAKHQDFQKVKIKVGKTLPKGLNETKTAFKSKSIQIKEQIRQESKEATTRRRLTVTELLSHCQHYSISTRHDALTGLRELVTAHPEILGAHLSNLVERVAPLCLDKDGVVRQATNRFFKVLFESVAASQIKPFFPVLSAHLRCAMTHIQDDIRLDSLYLLDLLLSHYPGLVTESNNKLLQCFIDQISKSSQESRSATRRLIVNPSSRITGTKWRIKVLERLQKFMEAIIISTKTKTEEKVAVKCWKLGDTNEHIPLAQFSANWLRGVSRINRNNNGSSSGHDTEDLLSRSFIEMLIPLLLQCWVEIGPAQLAADSAGNAMSHDALSMLSTILKIIRLIQENLRSCSADQSSNVEWMRTRFVKDFIQYFMAFFPYAAHQKLDNPKKKKSKAQKGGPQVSCLSINLCVCEVMSQFVHSNNIEDVDWYSQITHYLVQVAQRDIVSSEQLKSALNTVSILLKIPLDKEDEDEVLGAILALYTRKNLPVSDKVILLEFFLTCVQKKMVNLGLTNFGNWMSILPQQLGEFNSKVNPVAFKLIEVMKVLTSQNLPVFQKSFQKHSLNILGLIAPGLEELHKNVIELLTQLPEMERTHFVIIAKLCQDGVLSPSNLKYLFQVIVYRAHQNDKKQIVAAGDFLSCLASCLIGYCASDLVVLEQVSPRTSKVARFVINPSPPEKFERQLQVLEVVGDMLCSVPDEVAVWDMVTGALQGTLIKLHAVPEDLACSVLHILIRIMKHGYEPGEDLFEVLVDLAASCLHHILETGLSPPDSQGDNNKVSTTVQDLCESFLRSLQPACDRLVTKELLRILDVKDLKYAGKHVALLTKLLRDDTFRNNVRGKKSEIDKLLQASDDTHKGIASLVGWSDIKYAISLLKT